MISRHPKDVLEAFLGLCESHATVLSRLSDIAAEDQVIVRVGDELFQGFAVAFEGEVDVADGP